MSGSRERSSEDSRGLCLVSKPIPSASASGAFPLRISQRPGSSSAVRWLRVHQPLSPSLPPVPSTRSYFPFNITIVRLSPNRSVMTAVRLGTWLRQTPQKRENGGCEHSTRMRTPVSLGKGGPEGPGGGEFLFEPPFGILIRTAHTQHVCGQPPSCVRLFAAP